MFVCAQTAVRNMKVASMLDLRSCPTYIPSENFKKLPQSQI